MEGSRLPHSLTHWKSVGPRGISSTEVGLLTTHFFMKKSHRVSFSYSKRLHLFKQALLFPGQPTYMTMHSASTCKPYMTADISCDKGNGKSFREISLFEMVWHLCFHSYKFFTLWNSLIWKVNGCVWKCLSSLKSGVFKFLFTFVLIIRHWTETIHTRQNPAERQSHKTFLPMILLYFIFYFRTE